MTPNPSPESEPLEKDEAAEETRPLTAAKSEIELPSPTPTSTPKPTATPAPKPKETPGPTPKPARDAAHNVADGPTPKPKKAVLAKTSPKPSPKAKPTPTKSGEKAKKTDVSAEKKKTAPVRAESSSQTSGKTGPAGKVSQTGGESSASEFGWYGNMLHDRFYSAWIQPTTTVASGSKISTLVKVRIEKDGRVSKFEIIKPSENVVVNESVAAIAKRVTEVDPPPASLSNGDYYGVNINFELNADQETVK